MQDKSVLGRKNSSLGTSPHKSLPFRINASSSSTVITLIEGVYADAEGRTPNVVPPMRSSNAKVYNFYPLEHHRRVCPPECMCSKLSYITIQSLSFFSPSSKETAELGPPLRLRIGPDSPLPRPLAEPLVL